MIVEVYSAFSGKLLLTWEAHHGVRIGLLSAELVQLAALPIHFQILLCHDGNQLSPEAVWEQFPSLSTNNNIYLFDLKTLSERRPGGYYNGHPRPSFTVHLDPLPSSPEDRALLNHQNSIVRELPKYLYDFKQQAHAAEVFLSTFLAAVKHIASVVHDQGKQLSALTAAMNSLTLHADRLGKEFLNFSSLETKQRQYHSELLSSFEQDLAALGRYELRPELCHRDAQTLLDLVQEGKLRKDVDRSREFAMKNATKVEEARVFVSSLPEAIQQNSSTWQSRGLDSAQELLMDTDELAHQQRLHAQQLDQDEQDLRVCVNDWLQDPNTPLTQDFLNLCDVKSRGHQEELGQFQVVHSRTQDVLEALDASQSALSASMAHKMGWIMEMQSRIRDTGDKLSLYSELLKREASLFSPLAVLRKMPEAYVEAVPELQRRYDHRKTFVDLATSTSQQLASMSEQEANRRRLFFQQYGQYLPKKLSGAVDIRAPSCELRLTDGDAHLVGPTQGDFFAPPATPAASAASVPSPGPGTTPNDPTGSEMNERSAKQAQADHEGALEVMKDLGQMKITPIASQSRQTGSAQSTAQHAAHMDSLKCQQLEDKLQQQLEENKELRAKYSALQHEQKQTSQELHEKNHQLSQCLHDQIENENLKTINENLRDREDMWRLMASERISLTSFQINDLVLFVSTPRKISISPSPSVPPHHPAFSKPSSSPASSMDSSQAQPPKQPCDPCDRVYVALNRGCPNRFLSPLSLEAIQKRLEVLPEFLVGVVVSIERLEAKSEQAPVALGKEYFSLSVDLETVSRIQNATDVMPLGLDMNGLSS